jgi:hypothetical protein
MDNLHLPSISPDDWLQDNEAFRETGSEYSDLGLNDNED